MRAKICVIGAGSIAWSAKIICDLCFTESLGGSVISLMDKNRERLKIIHSFARDMPPRLRLI